MKGFKSKLIVLIVAMLVITMLVPFSSVAAANEGVQLIQTTEGDIVIYIDGLEKEAFDYALSDNGSATEMDLNYINSVEDEDGNQVALIAPEDLAGYLYVRRSDNAVTTVQLQVDTNNMFTQNKMSEVENTTKRISTGVLEDIVASEETVDEVTYIQYVGGLEITDDQNATYSYQMFDLTDERYNELQKLANELNSDYESKTMYSKIEFANRFYNLYNELMGEVEWQPVESMKIVQPMDAEEGEQYIVMLKKVAEDGTETYDAKFMTSFEGEALETIKQGYTDTQEVQRTSKLPITGDSIVLFVVLAALVIVAIVVFIRMKKLNKKADK